MKERVVLGCLLALLLAGCVPTLAADRPTNKPPHFREAYSGEVVVRSDEGLVVVLLDEADRKGKTDGQLDHVFSFWSLPPVFLFEPISIRDPEAEVELLGDGLRLVLHHHGRVMDFWLSGYPVDSRRRQYPSSYTQGDFEDIVSLTRYSGGAAQQFSMVDAEQMPLEQLRSETQNRVDAFLPPPDPEVDGGSCALTCTKSCTGGSCSTVCNKGFCAKCTCYGNPPTVFPHCICYLGKALGG